MMRKKKKSRCKSRRKPYTVGEINLAVDALLHPLYRQDEMFRFVDGAVHMVIEKDVRKSILKFVRYNRPGLLKKIAERC